MKRNISSGWALLLSGLLLFNFSCVKEDENTDDTEYPEFIVFGTFFSVTACSGNETCIELYKADATGLKEDEIVEAPDGMSAYPVFYSLHLSISRYPPVLFLFYSKRFFSQW